MLLTFVAVVQLLLLRFPDHGLTLSLILVCSFLCVDFLMGDSGLSLGVGAAEADVDRVKNVGDKHDKVHCDVCSDHVDEVEPELVAYNRILDIVGEEEE